MIISKILFGHANLSIPHMLHMWWDELKNTVNFVKIGNSCAKSINLYPPTINCIYMYIGYKCYKCYQPNLLISNFLLELLSATKNYVGILSSWFFLFKLGKNCVEKSTRKKGKNTIRMDTIEQWRISCYKDTEGREGYTFCSWLCKQWELEQWVISWFRSATQAGIYIYLIVEV